jgi:hypothetical protein
MPSASSSALADFFGGSAPSYVSVEALLDPKLIVHLGVAPVRVDILSHFGTLTFAEAWRTRVDARFGFVDAHYLGRKQLIAEKTFSDVLRTVRMSPPCAQSPRALAELDARSNEVGSVRETLLRQR